MAGLRILPGALAICAMSGGVADAASSTIDLNMRSGPGASYQRIGVIPAGTPFDVLGCTGRWCRVSYAGRVGYATGRFLDDGGPRTTIVVRRAPVLPPWGPVGSEYRYKDYTYDSYAAHYGAGVLLSFEPSRQFRVGGVP
jgi:uncharacterized protein YraI